MQVSDDLYLGPVNAGGPVSAGPAPMENGVGPLGRLYVFDVQALALNLLGICAAQAVAAAGNLTLTTAATNIAYTQMANQKPLLVLDTPRAVDILSSSASDTAVVITISGFDQYSQPMTENITTNGTTRVPGKKAFKSIWQVSSSGAAVGNISVGTTDIIGLPYRVTDLGYITNLMFNQAAVTINSTNVKVAVQTSPATATTGDVRGTVNFGTNDGTKRGVMGIMLPGIACGPTATRIGALGVTQF